MSDRMRAHHLHLYEMMILSAVRLKNRVHNARLAEAGRKFTERLAKKGIKL